MTSIVLTVRQLLSQLMVEVNLVSPELADYHVARMADAEVEERLELYLRRITGKLQVKGMREDAPRRSETLSELGN